MKKLPFKNYLFIGFITLIIIGVIFLSLHYGSVKYFGFFIIILAILFVAVLFIQRTNNKSVKHYKSKVLEQLLRLQNRK